MNVENLDQCELSELALEYVTGGAHPAKVTVPDIKLGIGYTEHQSWSNAFMSLFF